MRKRELHAVILGAGYGGLRAALDLGSRIERGARLRVTLVDANDYHTLVNQLHRVATAGLPAEAARVPLSLLLDRRPIDFVHGRVEAIDLPGRQVTVEGKPLAFDALVIALGSQPDFHDIPGVEARALTVRSWRSAVEARDRIASIVSEQDLPVIVGGGGYTGVEVAGELADWLPEIGARQPHPILLELDNRLLPGFPGDLARRIERDLRRKRVDVRLGVGVAAADDVITLTDGGRQPFGALIWTGGICGPRLLQATTLKLTRTGRVPVDRYLRPRGYHDVFAIGDCAAIRDPVTGRPVAASAQLAVQEGATVARSIAAMEHGDAPWEFLPRSLGEIVSIGRYEAVADLGPLLVGGRAASAMKEFALQRYLNSIGGIRVLQEFDRRRFEDVQRAG